MIFIGCFGHGIDSSAPWSKGYTSSTFKKLIIFMFFRHCPEFSSEIGSLQVGHTLSTGGGTSCPSCPSYPS